MSESERKKSTSSESELSDGWSLVEHGDAMPTTPITYHPSDLISQSDSSLYSSQNMASTAPVLSTTEPEISSSDAESVEIIHEDALLTDFGLHETITRVTKVKPDDSKGSLESGNYGAGKELVGCIPETDFSISSSSYTNEWLRLLIFTSSLIALLLLLVSYASFFFKEQAYSKPDGLIVLPDEDLSSLIADLALFKEENTRLKEQLNKIKYEYGNDKQIKPEEISIPISSSDEVFGFEVITDEVPTKSEPKHFKLEDFRGKIPSESPSTDQPSTDNPSVQKIEDLKKLEENLKIFADNIGLKNFVISSHRIVNKLNDVNIIIKNLDLIIDKQTSAKNKNRKNQMQQKLTKLLIKIEDNFIKCFDKVSKRVNKFHNEFLSTFCRIKGGVSDVDGIDCSGFDRLNEGSNKYNENMNKELYSNLRKDKSKDRVIPKREPTESRQLNPNHVVNEDVHDSISMSDSVLNFENEDFILEQVNRFKRNSDNKKHTNDFNSNSNSPKVDSQGSYTTSQFQKKKSKKSEFDSNNNIDDNGSINNFDKHSDRNNNNFEKKPVSGFDPSRNREAKLKDKVTKNKNFRGNNKMNGGKTDKKVKPTYQEEKFAADRPVDGKESFRRLDGIINPKEQGAVFLGDGDTNRDVPVHQREGHGNSKCTKKNCIKKDRKLNNKVKFYKNIVSDMFQHYESGKNPNSPSAIHNESAYSKMTNRHKAEPNGEWYLELGETRRQKRASHAIRGYTQGGWFFDRALVRDWCRTNADSSLCSKFGQACDYCA